MEYKRCIKITDNKLTDLREYTKSLVVVDTNNSEWGWDSQRGLGAETKNKILKICSDRAISTGTGVLTLQYSYYSLTSNGEYSRIYLQFGYYFASDDYVKITIDADFEDNLIISEYNEV